MPIAPTYPGVYVEELPSGVHTITGVSTAVTAFLGFFSQGPMNTPVQIFSVADLQRNFGSLIINSEAGYGIQQFFANGGAEAWVVRVASSTSLSPLGLAAIEIQENPGGTPVLTASAASPGSWGNSVRLAVDYNTAVPGTGFNLTVTQVDSSSPPNTVATEVYRNLVLDPTSSSFAPAVVNAASALIQLALVGTQSPGSKVVPAQTGTVSGTITTAAMSTLLTEVPGMEMTVDFIVPGATTTTVTGTAIYPSTAPTTAIDLASTLQGVLQGLRASDGTPVIPNATVSLIQGAGGAISLQISEVSSSPDATITFSAPPSPTPSSQDLAAALQLESAAVVNVLQYALGGTAAEAQAVPTAQAPFTSNVGGDGDQPDANALIGNQGAKTGMYALENAPGFNILCLPDVMNRSDNDAFAVISAAETYCQSKYAFLIVDVPQNSAGGVDMPALRDSTTGIQTWMAANSTLRNSYAALYFPRPQIPDPLNGFRLRPVASSGTLAGLYAQTDGTRGVWKAPAGTAAVLTNVSAVAYVLNDAGERGAQPVGHQLSAQLSRCTATSAGGRAPLTAPISLSRSGNTSRCAGWPSTSRRACIRDCSGCASNPTTSRCGRRSGSTSALSCSSSSGRARSRAARPPAPTSSSAIPSTTTQADINQGVVNIMVGFAPLLPAEFVILQIQQIAGQSPT